MSNKSKSDKNKRVYKKPKIEAERIYEDEALACGKDPAGARRRGFGNPCRRFTKS